jgi:hypothetical protein
MNTDLNPEKVHQTFLDCLYDDSEERNDAVYASGITLKCGFHPERLAKNTPAIVGMLMQLPDDFMQTKGGGMSFINACVDKNGNQWTGMHRIMEELFIMGIATGKVSECMPREMWGLLPGGMPYYMVKDKPDA